MKCTCLIFFLVYFQLSLSQTTYTSPITEHFPSRSLEFINRTITFTDSVVKFESVTPTGKQIREYAIQEKERVNNQEHGLSDFYVCSTSNGVLITYILIPVQDKVEFMEIVRPKQLGREAVHYRLLVD